MYSIKTFIVKETSHIRDKKMYYSPQGNASLQNLFSDGSNNHKNISFEEIYGIDYSTSIYLFQTTYNSANTSDTSNLGIIETSLTSIFGWDGAKQSNDQLGLTFLSSSVEACASFAFLVGRGAKSYKIRLQMFTKQGSTPSLEGFMSLPNQARSFERFQLFDKPMRLPEKKNTAVDYLVYSPKFMQKRNTAEEPCVDVENYDKVT
jgi:hypothetical protein